MTPLLQDLRTGLDLCRAGRRDEAADIYRRLAAQAASADELELLGRLAGGLGQHADAIICLERAVSVAPDAGRLAALGEARLAARDFTGAVDSFQRAVGVDAETLSGWVGLGDALRELARWDAAAAAYGEARTRDPHAMDALVGLALALAGGGRSEEAIAAAAAALDIDGSAAAYRALAVGLLRAQRIEGAEQACLTALDRCPDYAEARATLALVRMMQGRLEEADALFSAAAEAKPTLAEAIGNHAILLVRLGRDADAKRAAARSAKLKPFLPAPFNLLGTLMRRDGQMREAVEMFEQVLRLAPDHLEARVNLADTLRLLGDPQASAEVCRAGLAMRKDEIGLLANLGAALQELEDIEGASAAYGRVLELRPGLPEVENNLARLHLSAGRHGEALLHLRRAAEARPGDSEIARNLSAALLDAAAASGADPALLAEAETAARTAVRLALASGMADRQLAHVLERRGRVAAAAEVLRAVLCAAPDNAEAWLHAGALQLRAGERARAVPYCRRAARTAPGNARAWAMFAQALHGLRLTAAGAALRTDLLEAFVQPGAEKAYLVDAAVSVVDLNPAMIRLRTAAASSEPDAAVTGLLRQAFMTALAEDRLLCALLRSTVVTDPGLEHMLTLLRRALLGVAGQDGVSVLDHPDWRPFLHALADQCLLNEYAFAETEAERAAADALGVALAGAIERKEVPLAARVALFAAYRPLARWEGASALLAHETWSGGMAALLDRHVREPLDEDARAKGMERLIPVDDAVSRAVRTQYEENPYPRWRHAGLLDAPMPVDRVVRAVLPHVALEPGPWLVAPEVLVAGCGTGRETVWVANQIAGARVLAVDLSLASLAYAQRQTEALGIASVRYAQADILGLAALGRRFDLVQSVGVLHHMADPLAGWRILTGLLQPHGIMKIGLYSARARGAVTAARDLIARRGYDATPEGIRRFRAEVWGLPADHPVAPIRHSPDFYNISACRDLLFHVQEHCTTLPEIAGWLEVLGLEFLGFQFDDPAMLRIYRTRFPEDPNATSLTLWDRFEAEHPHTFAGLYQFWVRFRH